MSGTKALQDNSHKQTKALLPLTAGMFKATFFLVMQTQADTSASLQMYEPLLGSKEVKSKYLVGNYSKVDWCNHALTDTILRRDCTRLQTILYEHILMPRAAT